MSKELTVLVNPLDLYRYVRPDIAVVDRMRAAGIPVLGMGEYQGVAFGKLYSRIEDSGDVAYLWSSK